VASFFGTSATTGTIEVGKRADLVLLDANPLTDVRNTTRRAGVMLGGRWLPKSVIDARLDAVAKSLGN
jgi:imidazolonepropionase-like amidohydrolase